MKFDHIVKYTFITNQKKAPPIILLQMETFDLILGEYVQTDSFVFEPTSEVTGPPSGFTRVIVPETGDYLVSYIVSL
jgi:hypothetical protein